MKKSALCTLALSLAALNANSAAAFDADLLSKTLSLSYGAPVKAEISEDKCQIIYPEVKMEQDIYAPDADVKNSAGKKTITETIPATTLDCTKMADFKNYAQYKAVNNSTNRLMGQVYNLIPLPFINELEVKSFQEEIQVVPELGFTSAYNLNFAEASYTEKDEESGMKRDVAVLKNLVSKYGIYPLGDGYRYLYDIEFKNFNIMLPMASLHFGPYHQVAEAVYQPNEKQPFSYTDMLQNVTLLKSSRTRVTLKDVKISSDMMDAKISFDVESHSDADVNASGMLDSAGTMTIDNIKFTGDILDAAKQPKKISFDVFFDGLNLQSLSSLIGFQQKLQELAESGASDSEIEAEISNYNYDEIVKSLNEALDTAKLRETVKVEFADAEIKAVFEFYRKDMYLQGYGNFTINNFFNIFPELKECQSNPQAQACMYNPFYAGLSEYIDLSKNPAKCNLMFSSDGIFLNGEKVSEPLKLDLQEIFSNDNLSSGSADTSLGQSASSDSDDFEYDELDTSFMQDDMLDKIARDLDK